MSPLLTLTRVCKGKHSLARMTLSYILPTAYSVLSLVLLKGTTYFVDCVGNQDIVLAMWSKSRAIATSVAGSSWSVQGLQLKTSKHAINPVDIIIVCLIGMTIQIFTQLPRRPVVFHQIGNKSITQVRLFRLLNSAARNQFYGQGPEQSWFYFRLGTLHVGWAVWAGLYLSLSERMSCHAPSLVDCVCLSV